MQNETVDDSAAQLVWTGSWSTTTSCTSTDVSCISGSDASELYDRSWHVGQRGANSAVLEMEFTFNGTALWLYGVTLPSNSLTPQNKDTSLAFTLDGVQQDGFYNAPTGETEVLYNVLFFSKDGLSDGVHSLVLTVNPDSVAIVDYLVVEQSQCV